MKSVSLNKDNNFSLNLIENYKKDLECDVSIVTKKYTELIVEYFKFIIENIKLNNINFAKFIIIRGLDTITNVFLSLLYFTKNIGLTYFHCQKSFYFYVEFVGQISDDEKMFLQLTSRDATTYVYKKTIFEINNEFKKLNESSTSAFRQKLDIIHKYISIYQTYLLKIIKAPKLETSNVEHLVRLADKLNNIENKTKIAALENIIEKLYNKIDDLSIFFEINHLLVKKFVKNPEIIKNAEKKINLEEFEDKIKDPNDKFISWLLSNSS
jgi:hypothetical protein